VEGENFFGREKELDFAWKQIQKGNSMILSAPRRVGKSSFAKKILTMAKVEGWNTLEINLEEIKSEEGFVKIFVEKIKNENWWDKAKSKAGKIIESIKPEIEYEGVKATLEWKSQKVDIYEKLKNLIDHSKETLIMVDELTILLNCFLENDKENGKQNVEFFLNWLRSFRQVSCTKIRWVFCSSIGIENFASQHNLSLTLNDVPPFPIGAFSESQSILFINALSQSEGITLPEKLQLYMVNKIGWCLPYFIQILFLNFHKLIELENHPVSTETIDKAYEILIMEKHLNTWDERLKEYSNLQTNARAILKNLSQNTEGQTRESIYSLLYAKIKDEDETEKIVSQLLNMLSNDGYLIENNSKYAFRSPLLRDFWFNRFVK